MPICGKCGISLLPNRPECPRCGASVRPATLPALVGGVIAMAVFGAGSAGFLARPAPTPTLTRPAKPPKTDPAAPKSPADPLAPPSAEATALPAGVGSCAPAELAKVIERGRKRLAGCRQGKPGPEGRLTVEITIGSSGSVREIAVKEDTIGDADVQACVARAVRSWSFPDQEHSCTTTFPLAFAAGE